MSGIFDQIINYSPPLIVSGTVNYKGTWNASTNNPTLNDPPAASTKGDYYVVSTAGTQFSITFGVGDWIISNGTAWEKVDLTDAVHSVFGRTGAVVGDSTDYSAVGLTNTAIGAANPSSGAFTSLSSSSTTTLNGTTVPASKTLVVTTDKLSALAATTSAELAGVISDETGSGALVFATSPTLVTPALGTPSSGTVTNLTGTASININGTVGATTPTTGVFTGLTVNDNTTLGSSNSDTVNFNARVASDLNPSTDNTYDLGVTGHEWRNLNIDGTANIDSLVADTADINGGTIDGTAIGSGTASTGAFTTVSATGILTVNNTGGTAPTPSVPLINLVGSSTNRVVNLFTFGGNSAILARRANGTVGSPTALLNGENAFVIRTGGYGATGFDGGSGASIQFPATENWTDSAQGQNVLITATANSATVSSTIGTFSSTGLAVTGALSATGTSLTLGTNSGSGSSRRVFDIEAGGYASPGAFNTDSNGDKINLFKGGAGLSFDARIGVGTANNVWYRSSGSTSGAGVHEFYVGSTPTLIQSISATGLAVTGNGSFTATQPTLSLIATGGTNSSNLVFTPAVGYDAIISTSVASKLIFKYNSTEVARIDSGSFAVTGALSSTGALAIGNTVATAVAVASTHKVTIVIGGTTYYLLATNV
jgi:hypothetical protein